ncbi:unnamed protein product [Meloidogyne enterolobii]|uniref:Uncharacterized protein n=1 Tax=Meloidogyne enterolobii TaxID=390850 RepID=A0ACB0YIY5_MELEN
MPAFTDERPNFDNSFNKNKISPNNNIKLPEINFIYLKDEEENTKSSSPPSLNKKLKTDWKSIYISTLVTFCCQVQFSLFLNSQFAYMKNLDPQITEIFFGFVVGGYSLVQMVLTPLVGIWAEKIEQIKLPLLITNFFMLFGNIIYFFVELFPNNWIKTIFIIARLVSGIGPAQNSLLISYAASASLDKDRSTATAFITGGIAFGVTMGPSKKIKK